MNKLEQVINSLKGKHIVVLGAGLTGMSCLELLHAQQLPATVIDSRFDIANQADFEQRFPTSTLLLGGWHFDIIQTADIILASPGIDLAKEGISKFLQPSCEVLGDVELFARLNDSPVVAVTGSNGKSTVVSLLAHVGRALGKKVSLCGNIGEPVLTQWQHQVDVHILELSSFQLETTEHLYLQSASVLNVSDDHLDRHQTIDNYARIKRKIYRHCQTAIVNRQDPMTRVQEPSDAKYVISFGTDVPSEGQFGIKHINGQIYLCKASKALISLNTLPLAGMHNAMNYLAVLALSDSLNWNIEDVVNQLAGFKGLAHRCQRVDSQDGIHWVNDSKATNVGATIAAIDGIAATCSNNQIIVIAGGEGKGADFSPLAVSINNHVSHLITLGKDGKKIGELAKDFHYVNDMREAVSLAKTLAVPGDVVLLSPACASLDMFSNYIERGKVFSDAVTEMQEASA
ncbi:UDP-N-acetylmuramoyl-L-alanine--D-glutamate ligase [Thalassotalea ganghwensis]